MVRYIHSGDRAEADDRKHGANERQPAGGEERQDVEASAELGTGMKASDREQGDDKEGADEGGTAQGRSPGREDAGSESGQGQAVANGAPGISPTGGNPGALSVTGTDKPAEGPLLSTAGKGTGAGNAAAAVNPGAIAYNPGIANDSGADAASGGADNAAGAASAGAGAVAGDLAVNSRLLDHGQEHAIGNDDRRIDMTAPLGRGNAQGAGGDVEAGNDGGARPGSGADLQNGGDDLASQEAQYDSGSGDEDSVGVDDVGAQESELQASPEDDGNVRGGTASSAESAGQNAGIADESQSRSGGGAEENSYRAQAGGNSEAEAEPGETGTEEGINAQSGSEADALNGTGQSGIEQNVGGTEPGGAGDNGTADGQMGSMGEQDVNGSSFSAGGQDAEASDELGAEESPRGGFFGFLHSIFGEDGSEEDEESAAGQAADAQDGGQSKSDPEKFSAISHEDGGDEQKHGVKADQREIRLKVGPSGGEEDQKPKDPRQEKRDAEMSDSLEESVIYWQGVDKISDSLKQTKDTLTEVLGLGSSFDLVFREMRFGGRKAALLCISGFANSAIIDDILRRLTYLTPDNVNSDVVADFANEYIPHVQVEKGTVLSESINKVLTGMSALFIDGETTAIIMDTRMYPSRNPDEPSIERVVRGARDGFTETLLQNVALVRRRLRDPGLKYEMHQVGRRTRTDVCVAYIDDIVDKTQVKAVTDQIKGLNIDGIPLADKQLEEAIVAKGWNPYPMVRYSERPDVVASHLMEGRVVVFVDTSPSVMILPTTFFDLCQHAEENRQTPFMGTYLRWVRFIGIFASMFLLPLWMLMVIHPELKPPMLDFIGPQKMAKIPLIAQFLIVELGVDLLRMAAVHTPTPLGSAMGLIAAILVGDIAVQTGLFVNEVVLYMAVASIGMFATPSYELGLANRIVRLVLLVAVAAFGVPGFVIGTTLLIILLTTHRSYNSSYLWPFIPFNAKAMGAIILRPPVLSSKTRPSFNKTRDNTRMPLSDAKKE